MPSWALANSIFSEFYQAQSPIPAVNSPARDAGHAQHIQIQQEKYLFAPAVAG